MSDWTVPHALPNQLLRPELLASTEVLHTLEGARSAPVGTPVWCGVLPMFHRMICCWTWATSLLALELAVMAPAPPPMPSPRPRTAMPVPTQASGLCLYHSGKDWPCVGGGSRPGPGTGPGPGVTSGGGVGVGVGVGP